ncbi:Aspyridones efflux protein apdF [Psilocybe cubensis]|uniref:Major facilitator superfamily (MFS) profile domain-containing protein n=2 Tax=Psilocybe cubensis TaxID=181762 RepID=A0A8H7XRZ1_PSICU|nr:Aspyridones efflux protein apdF [Psilocybe cubensis]KAH9474617.1 Aspyridones efflux protein apdF [Psilocybe cubensis]
MSASSHIPTKSSQDDMASKEYVQTEYPSISASEVEATSPTNLKFDEGALLGAWLVQFCVLGLPLSFGVMESFYAEHYLSNFTPSTINWIGSIQLCFEFLLGVVVAGVFDAGHFRWISIPASVLFVFSMFMLSLAKQEQYYQIFLSQGLGAGIAIGMLYTPTSSAVSQHFKKKRGFAMGIITTGGALGGAFFSIVLGHFLNGSIGFAWGVRICAFICLGCLILANLLMSTQYPPPTSVVTNEQPVGIPLAQLVRSTSYISFILFAFVISISLYNPMFSVELFALRNAHVSQALGGYLLAILNVSSIFGRLFFNRLADRYGVFEVYIPCITATGKSGFLRVIASVMTKCTSVASIIVFCILYGIFSGSAVSLYFPAVLSLDRDVTRSGLRLGLASVPVGIASLVGTPIAAAVVGHDRWWAGSVFTGVLELTAALLLTISFLTKPKY